MNHRTAANRTPLGLALAASTLLAAGCGGSGGRPAPAGSVQNPGVVGTYFEVVVSRPEGGTVRSADGAIVCGTGGAACSARYAWTAQVVLTATPDAGWMFGTWAGDCHYNGPCTLDTSVYGADKFVVAVFGQGDDGVLHGNFYSPAIHGPAFLDRLAGLPGTFNCSSTACHGPTYDGTQTVPSCNACHASAGWTSWSTNCTFCHGTRARSGYDFAADPLRAAPPDAISERLSGTPAPARSGAHRAHLTGTTAAGAALSSPFPCAVCHAVPADLSHVGGAAARASVVLTGAGHASLPASLGTWDPAAGTCASYCHGDGHAAGLSPSFATTVSACDGCHGVPPRTGGHPYTGADLTRCAGCHPETMNAAGAIVAGGGRHVDGAIQGTAACDGCHGFPPPSGAHVRHFGLAGTSTSFYGDTRALQDMFPGATPPTAPAQYAFGCGSCHPLDGGRHDDGTVDVELANAAAPAASLKALAAPGARWDAATGTCSGTYCHSSGQEAPAFGSAPAWTSAGPLACGACHGNPPRYASGGAGTATANGHLALDAYTWVAGHFGGVGAFGHADRHGDPYPTWPGDDAAITCQTCHYDTTDPAATGPSGFYWLDTTGDYELAGRDPGQGAVGCTSCHTGAGDAVVRAGRVLPLRHVNGARDVVFDPRPVIDRPIAYLPAAPDTPERPYYRTHPAGNAWLGSVVNGSTRSFNLVGAQYDARTKTCTVACHMPIEISGIQTRWGAPFDWNCASCHPY